MQHDNLAEALVAKYSQEVGHVDVEQLFSKQQQNEDFVLIDVRGDGEWDKGHISGAVHLNKNLIELKVQKQVPDVSTAIVVYCGGGSRSVLAAYNLVQMGYTNVASLDGGFRAWQAAGHDLGSEG